MSEQLSEEPQSERGEPGSPDSGSDEPSGRAVDRPEGSIDDEAVPSHSDTDESAVGELRRHRDPSAGDT
jgi:hypothetical protein